MDGERARAGVKLAADTGTLILLPTSLINFFGAQNDVFPYKCKSMNNCRLQGGSGGSCWLLHILVTRDVARDSGHPGHAARHAGRPGLGPA